jgi:hypothetical protein
MARKSPEITGVEIIFSRKNDSRIDRNYDKTALGLTGRLIE